MELVVGASGETMRSLLSKLGGLLSEEYTLIRGVDGDLQYINDELATMQSFLRYVGSRRGHDELTKDWMKQIRDLTYDIEDCIDDSGNILHGLPTGMPCYFLLNSVFEILTWWPRRDIASRISTLKMRAQQIGERRERYGVNNPQTAEPPAGAGAAVFVPADNQDGRLQLVDMKDPVGVEQHMKDLSKRVTCLVGFGGVGKTAIATALYRKLKEKFDHSAVVTVSQSSDVEAILRSIINQIKPKASNLQQEGDSAESVMATVKGVMAKCCSAGTSEGNQIKPKASNRQQEGGSAESVMATVKGIMAKCCSAGTSEGKHDGTKMQLMKELGELIKKNSYVVLIDDVWSAIMLENIIKALPYHEGSHTENSRIIVTTRFHSVATTRREAELRRVTGLAEEKSKKLFEQAFSESRGSKHVTIIWPQDSATLPNTEEVNAQNVLKKTRGRVQPGLRDKPKVRVRLRKRVDGPTNKPVHSSKKATPKSEGGKDATVPNEVWKMCGGLPMAIVTMAGNVACNPDKSFKYWSNVCSSLFPELGQDHRNELTQEELGKIISYCYNDMPPEIKTCSMYLSIFPKGHKISRKRLTRRWIAEGFVCEKHGLSVEEVAEIYFNHLVRRKIIRPVEHSSNGKVKKCIVHDMVLDHIVAKASEENFITVVGGNWLMQPPSSKVRRLSLQVSDSNRAKDTEKMNMSHVRSVTMFGSLNNQLHAHLFKLGIVQIMDLEGCTGFKQHHIIGICRMVLLKYLSLRKTDTKFLPNKIKKLKNLETLDIRDTDIVELPYTICQLERLVNILGGNKKTRKALKLPEELNKRKKMKALRMLSGIEVAGASVDLHHLTELRKLAIYKLKTKGDAASFKELISSIEYLGGYSLHTLVIDDESSEFIKSLDDLSSPPKFLIALELSGKMVKLPNWLKQLNTLSKLTLSVTALRTDNLKDLSKLEALFSLTFSFRAKEPDRQTLAIVGENKLYSNGKVTVPKGGFRSLQLMRLSGFLLPLLSFSSGAMPELERLELRYNMLEGLSGVENLVKLKQVHFTSDAKAGYGTMTKDIVEEVKNALSINGKTSKIIVHL